MSRIFDHLYYQTDEGRQARLRVLIMFFLTGFAGITWLIFWFLNLDEARLMGLVALLGFALILVFAQDGRIGALEMDVKGLKGG